MPALTLEGRLAEALDAELASSDFAPGYAGAPKIDFNSALDLAKKVYATIEGNSALIGKLLPPDVVDAADKTQQAVIASAAAVAAILRVVRPAA